MAALRHAFVFLFIWSMNSTIFTYGTPQFLLLNGKPKCFSVEVPKETMIKIIYESPEIDVNKESKQYSPTYITLLEKPIETLEEQRLEHEADDKVEQRKAQLQDRAKRKPKPVSQEINDYAGSFLHRIHIEDAIVDVCIRASKASPQQPMLFHLRLEELDEDVLDQFEQEKADQVQPPLLGVEHHWSFMETQFNRIEHEIHTIIKEADFFRERDALYHQQTDELHKATLFWPILHCFILVLTGFTQANHIISFFKTRRII